MELVDILRALARQWRWLPAGALLAVMTGLAVHYRVTVAPLALTERASTQSAAQARVLLDAPEEPPTVDLDSSVADTAGLRAGLLADLLATDRARAAIAVRSGVAMSDLAVLPPASDPPALRIPLAVAAADAARAGSEPYVLSVAADTAIPIISFSVAAPDRTSARRIAAAAAAEYEALLAVDGTPGGSAQLSVERLGPIRTSTTVSRLHPAFGVAAAGAVFALWVAVLVLLAGLRRGWRAAAPVNVNG